MPLYLENSNRIATVSRSNPALGSFLDRHTLIPIKWNRGMTQ